MRLKLFTIIALILLSTGVITLLHIYKAARQNYNTAIQLTGGDPWQGEQKIGHYGCSSCHTIPGIAGADAMVGPPLTKMGTRSYIGGVIANTPNNMITWLKDPPSVDPKTAMPKVGLSDTDARDIASYLYTLR
jgi:cytochrome c